MMTPASSFNDSNHPDGSLEGEEATRASSTRREKRRERRRPRKVRTITTLIFHPVFVILFALLVVALCISFFLVLNHPDETPMTGGGDAAASFDQGKAKPRIAQDLAEVRPKLVPKQGAPDQQPDHGAKDDTNQNESNTGDVQKLHGHQPKLVPKYTPKIFDTANDSPHLVPYAPPLPIFATIPDSQQLIDDLLHNNKPTMAGIIALLHGYLQKLHDQNQENSKIKDLPEMNIIADYYTLTRDTLGPFEEAYRGRTIFPIREAEDSVFISLAAFREHLLAQTLMSAFDQAEHPEKLFIGAVVQNCFGLDGTVCRTGVQVVGTDAKGNPMTKVSDAPPDQNGVEVFCTNPKYKSYCDNGHVRAIYLHDTDALGPATARYYASKLWGGETYFMQMDSHLEFAPHWDTKYKNEVKAAKSYPKAVLSTYPPGFSEFTNEFQGGSPGPRLCYCEFSSNAIENHIIRINTSGQTPPDAKRPTQIAFIAAGFFFAHASFLQDWPFDPYAPWCFMGEEIALSMRAWTHGWDIYAPLKSYIAHQYRPGRMGLPKFWESVGRDAGRPGLNTKAQKHVLRRIKHMVGYTTDTEELIEKDGDGIVLTDFEHYSLGQNRTLQAYLELTNIDVVHQQCKSMPWCSKGTLE